MNKNIAWALWLIGICGVFPLHRIYLGKPFLLRLFTLNWFVFGGIADMASINRWAEENTIRKSHYNQAKG